MSPRKLTFAGRVDASESSGITARTLIAWTGVHAIFIKARASKRIFKWRRGDTWQSAEASIFIRWSIRSDDRDQRDRNFKIQRGRHVALLEISIPHRTVAMRRDLNSLWRRLDSSEVSDLHRTDHDQALRTAGTWSRFDCSSTAPQSHRDRSSIAPRSQLDPTAIVVRLNHDHGFYVARSWHMSFLL